MIINVILIHQESKVSQRTNGAMASTHSESNDATNKMKK
jgi:hypothetical protein